MRPEVGPLIGRRAATALFVAGVACLDLSAFRVYRYLLLSDVLLLGACLVQARHDRSGVVYAPALIGFAFLLYLAATAASFLRPLDPAAGMMTWLHSAFVMLVYVPAVTTLLVRRPDLRHVAIVTILVSVSVQAWVVTERLAFGQQWTTGVRIAGAFGSSQVWPYLCAVVAALGLLLTGNWRLKLLSVAGLAWLAPAELFLRSRMLWMATLIGGCLLLFLQVRNRLVSSALMAAAGLLLVLGYVAGLYPAPIQARIASTLRPAQAEDLSARIRVAEDALSAVVDSPLVGVGIGQSPAYFTGLPFPPPIVNVHNVLLHAAVEGGLLAAFALALLPLGIVRLWRAALAAAGGAARRMEINWAGASLLAIFVAAQLTPTLYEHTFYFLIGFLASTARPRGA